MLVQAIPLKNGFCKLTLLHLFLVIGGWQFFTVSYAQELLFNEPVPLTSNWEYRWGVSPLNDNGTPTWLLEPMDSPHWNSFKLPIQINRNLKIPNWEQNRSLEKLVSNSKDAFEEYSNLWVRISLPAGGWKDPSLYIAGAIDANLL